MDPVQPKLKLLSIERHLRNFIYVVILNLGNLSGPDLVCHLSNPLTNQYHVTRANPLCSEMMKKPSVQGTDGDVDDASSDGKEDGFFSLSTMSMDDKVHRFLAHAVELANQNSKTVTLDPPPTNPGSDFS